MVNELLRSKYKGITFYCHNLGGYNVVFLLRVLLDYNYLHPEDEYDINYVLRDDSMLKVTIGKNKNSFSILDSFAMLPDRLLKLGENFGV